MNIYIWASLILFMNLLKYYEPFDQLYFYWKTFKALVKYSCPTLINNFTYSYKGVEYCEKSLIKL